MKRGIKHEVPSLIKELLEIVNCQEEESILIILQPLVKLTTLRLIPHIQEYLWIKKGPFFKKKKKTLLCGQRRLDLVRVAVYVNLIKHTQNSKNTKRIFKKLKGIKNVGYNKCYKNK